MTQPSADSPRDRAFVLPVYLVIDTSASLAGDMNVVNEALADLIAAIGQNVMLTDSVRMAVVSFDSTARLIAGLSNIDGLRPPPLLQAGGTTDYGAAFRLLRKIIPDDVSRVKNSGERVYRPVVFFLSDGSPIDPDWRSDLNALRAPEFRERPTMIAFGIGSVDPSVLREVGAGLGGAFMVANRLDIGASIESIFAGLTAMIVSTIESSTSPAFSPSAMSLPDDWLDVSDVDGL